MVNLLLRETTLASLERADLVKNHDPRRSSGGTRFHALGKIRLKEGLSPPSRAVTCSRWSPTTASPRLPRSKSVRTNEARHFELLLAPPDLASAVGTFDALHGVRRSSTASRDEEGSLHRRHQDQPAHRLRPARRPALDVDQGLVYRLRHRPPPLRVPLNQDLRHRRQRRRHRSPAHLAIGSTAVVSPPGGPRPARTSPRSPASPPIKPAPPTSPTAI